MSGVSEVPIKFPPVISSYHFGFEIPEVSKGDAASFKQKLTTEFATVGATGDGVTFAII